MVQICTARTVSTVSPLATVVDLAGALVRTLAGAGIEVESVTVDLYREGGSVGIIVAEPADVAAVLGGLKREEWDGRCRVSYHGDWHGIEVRVNQHA